MNAKIGWTISALGLVVMFFVARYYVGMALDAETSAAPADRMIAPSSHPRPQKAAEPRKERKKREADPLQPVVEISMRVQGLQEAGEDGRADVVADAHAALAELDSVEVEWTPELTERAKAVLLDAEVAVRGLRTPQPDVLAHVLSARVELAKARGAPDAEAEAALAAMEKSDPGAFTWR